MTKINTKIRPLHQITPENLYSDRGEDYAKYRPSYPTEVIDTILDGLGDPSQLTAADIGAGTLGLKWMT